MPTARMQRSEVGSRRSEINNFGLRIGMGIEHGAQRKESDDRGQTTAGSVVIRSYSGVLPV